MESVARNKTNEINERNDTGVLSVHTRVETPSWVDEGVVSVAGNSSSMMGWKDFKGRDNASSVIKGVEGGRRVKRRTSTRKRRVKKVMQMIGRPRFKNLEP